MKKFIIAAALTLSSNVFASSLIPPFGMSCTSDDGYILDLIPVSEGRVEFNLVDSTGNIVDDNIHGYKVVTDQSIHELVVEGDDGTVSFEVLGLKEDNVSDSYVQYDNNVLKIRLHLSHCDII